jgi:polar amino acid transport system permease protein
VTDLDRFVETFLNPALAQKTWPAIANGVLVTVEVALAVVATGLALGLALAYLRAYRIRPLNALIIVLVDVFRAVPPLVIILIAYFGLPNVGVTLSAFAVLWLVLSLVLAAFSEEILWAGILSVRKGQWDAARSTGLTFGETLRTVILPQAFRLAIPPLTNRTIAITKNTALGSVIGVAEIINQAQTAVAVTGNATPLMMAAVAYLLVFIPVLALAGRIERRFAWNRA